MTTRQDVLECSVSNFTKFGSKRFTMDELAHTLGVSKKTIYRYYSSKEKLVVASVEYLVEDFNKAVTEIIGQNKDSLVAIIQIYQLGFERLRHFKPSFFFGLKKYYPSAKKIFDDFRDDLVKSKVFTLLETAQKSNIIKPEVNLELFCELYFNRFEEVVFKNVDLFGNYSNEELLNHFVIYNLRGITIAEYSNEYFK